MDTTPTTGGTDAHGGKSTGETQAETLPLADGIFNHAPEGDRKRGHFIAMGCFSHAENALERGRLVRPFVPLVYRKAIQNGAMVCVFSGPYTSRLEAESLSRRAAAATHITEFSLGSY
ncbi:MAG: hypothetical protein HQL73_12400 [Magnetococcales bacterium]|nr:hypothetical protein [Magnetococcales bacterium]